MVGLVLQFDSREQMLAWFEEQRGHSGALAHLTPDSGVREWSSLDHYIAPLFVVSDKSDGGRFLQVEEKLVSEVTVREFPYPKKEVA